MQRASTRSGRISFVAIASIFCVGLVVAMLFANRQSARGAAVEFMSALANGDVNKLTELSIVQDKTPDQIRAEWTQTMKYSKNFLFYWSITSDRQEEKEATVQLEVTKNPLSKMAYGEHKELQLEKVNGVWKVDVPEISRDFYPYLPQ